MTCNDVRPILLEADSAHPANQSAEVRAHLDVCRDCCKFTEQLFRLERDWKNLPMPVGANAAKEAFLRRLAGDLARPTKRTRKPWLPRLPRPAIAGIVAASLLLAVSLVAWQMMPGREIARETAREAARETAKAKLLDDIVDWQLALVEANEAGRAKLLKEAPKFQARLQLMSFNADDRQFAETMLDKGALLAQNPDPLVAAEHFDAVAEQIQQRLEKAAKSDKVGEADQWAARLGNIDERGVEGQLDQLDNGQKKKSKSWEKIASRNAHRHQALQKMLDESPEATRSQIHRTMKKGYRKS
jgi:hypothetical protein